MRRKQWLYVYRIVWATWNCFTCSIFTILLSHTGSYTHTWWHAIRYWMKWTYTGCDSLNVVCVLTQICIYENFIICWYSSREFYLRTHVNTTSTTATHMPFLETQLFYDEHIIKRWNQHISFKTCMQLRPAHIWII